MVNLKNGKPVVFVIMPFAPEFLPIFEKLIKPPLEEVGFTVKRADSDLSNQNILREFVQGIATADLVVADLTGLNSNVMYELGLAHAIGARVILLTQDLNDIPFDLRTYRAHQYSIAFYEADAAKEILTEIGRGILDGTAVFGNPIQDFAPELLPAEAPIRIQSADQHDDEGPTPSPTQPTPPGLPIPEARLGYLEALADLERINSELRSITDFIDSRAREMGERLQMHERRMTSARQQLGTKSNATVIAITDQVSLEFEEFTRDVSAPSGKIGELLFEYAELIDIVSSAVRIESQADIDDAVDAVQQMTASADTFEQVSHTIAQFSMMLLDAPAATRRLKISTSEAANVLASIAGALKDASVETSRARGIIENRLDSARVKLRSKATEADQPADTM